MLLAILLGIIVGASGVLLLQQWARDSMSEHSREPLPVEAFPHLAPSRRLPRRRAA